MSTIGLKKYNQISAFGSKDDKTLLAKKNNQSHDFWSKDDQRLMTYIWLHC